MKHAQLLKQDNKKIFVQRNENIRILPCGHYMHDKCAVGWFTTGNAVCPVCRDKSFEQTKKTIKKRKRVTI